MKRSIGKSYSIPPGILWIKIHIKWPSPGLLLRFHLVPLCALFAVSATLASFLFFSTPTSFPCLIDLSCPHMLSFSSLFNSKLRCHHSQRPPLTTLFKRVLPIPHLLCLQSTYNYLKSFLIYLFIFLPRYIP